MSRRSTTADTRPASESSAQPHGERVAITYEAQGVVMGYWGDILLVVWATQATPLHIGEFGRLAEQMLREHESISTVQLLAPGSTVPTHEARTALNALIEEHAARLIGCAAVLEGSGFWASTMRSFLTGLQLFQRKGFKTKICANLEDGAHWLAELQTRESGTSMQETDLVAAIEQLRTRPSVTRD